MSGLTAICRFHLPCVTTTFSSTQPASSLTQHGQHRTLHQHLPHSSKPWLPSHHIVLPQEALNSSLFSLPPHCSGLPLLPEPPCDWTWRPCFSTSPLPCWRHFQQCELIFFILTFLALHFSSTLQPTLANVNRKAYFFFYFLSLISP